MFEFLNGVTIDPTVTIAGIVAVCSLLPPVLTTAMNHHHEFRMKQLETMSGNRTQAFEKYLFAAGTILDVYSAPVTCDYEATKGLAYLYAPEDVWPIMDKLDKEIKEPDFEAARKTLVDVCKALSKSK